MQRVINLDDIQGNIPRAYGRYSFPFARYFFLNIADGGEAEGRKFVDKVRHRVTTAARWDPSDKPKVTTNIGFTFLGLYMLGLPQRTLQGMPEDFIAGMKDRAFVLGDRDPTRTEDEDQAWCANWDPIWQMNRAIGHPQDVHIWISINAQMAEPGSDQPAPELEQQSDWLRGICRASGDMVRIIAANGKNGDAEYQSASAVFMDLGGKRYPTSKEHFGFTDGIGDPVFEGQYPPDQEKEAVKGRGKWMNKDKGWQPLATGEFILGYPDESQELPPAAMPPNFVRNSSFMVYRKLHQNVGSYDAVIQQEAARFARVMNCSEHEATETLKAKMVGRWTDGVPLAQVPTFAEWQEFRHARGFDDPDPVAAIEAHRAYIASAESSDFRYANDMNGYRCPVGAHMRRVNTRDYLDPLNKMDSANPDATTQLNKRRRILRRGLPYGPSDLTQRSDETDQGVILMVVGASIFRQFEFVQQQWVQYGLDFHLGNHTCPILGNHDLHKRHVIPSDPADGKPPYVMSNLKTFVETRGGDYFFLPSMTGLEMIAMGIVDPT